MDDKTIAFADGTHVCRLGQGTWAMGKSPGRRDEEIRALRRGIELGMNIIDTAEMYGNERLVGEAIRGLRDRTFVVSKCLPSNADRRGTKRACERSLARLGIDRIDLYLLHWKGHYPLSETVQALQELQREGKIARWGVSNIDLPDMQLIASMPGGDSCATDQVLYNMCERGVEYDLLGWCRDRGMPVMAYSPIAEGRLLAHPTLQTIAARHDATPARIALAWVLRQPRVIAIPKAGNPAHTDDDYLSLDIRLTDDDLRDIDAAFPPPAHRIPLAGW